MLKDFPPSQLVRAVRVVAGGKVLVSPVITAKLIATYVQRHPASVEAPEALNSLSPRELEVFRLVVEGKSNSDVAAALYLTENTVKTHMTRILSTRPHDRFRQERDSEQNAAV